jgi:hypothetical protein
MINISSKDDSYQLLKLASDMTVDSILNIFFLCKKELKNTPYTVTFEEVSYLRVRSTHDVI